MVFVDVDTEMTITLGDTDMTIAETFPTRENCYYNVTDLTITDTNITVTTQHLDQHRHYNVTIIASNSRGQAVSYTRISMLL